VHAALGPGTALLGEDEWGDIASSSVFDDVDRPQDLTGMSSAVIPGTPDRGDLAGTAGSGQSP
jgi:hypothetical protein